MTNGSHSASMYDRQSRPSVHMPLSDEVVIDACEFMHAIYDDLSQINEMLSLNNPSLQLEGTAFFFSAFEVVSSLEPIYLQALTRAATLHGMLERTNIDGNKVVVDTVGFREAMNGLEGNVGNNDSSDEEDLTAITYYIQAIQPEKRKSAAKIEEEKKAEAIRKEKEKAKKESKEAPSLINTEDAKTKEEKENAKAEESEEIDYETPETNIQDIIEEMKKRRRTAEETKKDSPAANSKAKPFEDHNPLRAVQEHEGKVKQKWKILTLVSKGHCVVGAVFHAVNADNTAEFDPFFIERIKNCLSLMVEKDLVR